MKVPAFLFGTYADVSRAAKRRVKAYRQDGPAAFADDATIDVREREDALIVFKGPQPVLASSEHFQLFVLNDMLESPRPLATAEQVAAVFLGLLEFDWGVCALFSDKGGHVMSWQQHLQRPFLRAVRREWGYLDGLGPRYASSIALLGAGRPVGVRLLEASPSIRWLLARRGIQGAQQFEAPIVDLIERVEAQGEA